MKRKYFNPEMSASASLETISRERGPMTPRCGIFGAIHSVSTLKPPSVSAK